MQRARLSLRFPREQVVQMVRQLTGAHWSEEANTKPVPINLIAMYVDIVGRKLIAGNPRVMLATDDDETRPVVHAMEGWANKQIVKIGLAETLERCALNALFSVGICKVGIASPADAANEAWVLAAGEPYAASIDLDDFVYDVHARTFGQVSFMGHRYRAPLEVVKRLSKRSNMVTASNDPLFNLEGDERLNVLGRGFYGDQEEFEEMVDLWEVYLPRHKMVVTLLEDNLTGAGASQGDKYYGKPLWVQKYLGPDGGPYHILGFGKVPGNAMPKAPIQDLYDLHMHVNNILRKLMRQAERQKEVLPVTGQQTEDGGRAIETNDGEAFRCDNEAPRPVSFGGPSQANFQLFGAMKDLFSWLAGNLDVQGGLSPEAKTLGQEKLLSQSSSATISSMQDQMTNFTSGVIESLCWLWYHHPQKVMKSRFSVPGLEGLGINRKVSPRGGPGMARNADFDMMDVDIDPYSLPRMTPTDKLQVMEGAVTKIIIPMAQLLAQSGIAFDPNEYMQLLAKWSNLPELKQLLTIQEQPQQAEGQIGQGSPGAPGAGGPPQSAADDARHYVRHSQSNPSAAGKDLGRANAMKSATNGQPQGAGAA